MYLSHIPNDLGKEAVYDMNAEDFQDLYKLLRGSKSAFAVLDARTLFIDNQFRAALAKVIEAQESYQQSRSRLMKSAAKDQVNPREKDAERQIRKIERKQEKVREILKKFDEVIPPLTKKADREEPIEIAADQVFDSEADATQATVTESGIQDTIEMDDERPAAPEDVTAEFVARFLKSEGDEQLDLISAHFGFRPVESEEDIFANSLYFIRIEDESFLVYTGDEAAMSNGVPLVSAVDKIPMKTYTQEAFLRLGARRRMVLLTKDSFRAA